MSRSAVEDDLFELIRGGGAQGSSITPDLRSSPVHSPDPVPGGSRNHVWCNPKMRVIGELLEKVAAWNVPVVFRGESGAGKEVLAREVHRLSPRSSKHFVKINCAALPSDLLESELFGYERGAFTGAVKTKPGKFEMADGGTIFLDEIGEMDQLLQAKLLQVLQDGEVHHLGGTEPIRVDARVLVATHRNLERAIENGSFREDLYYRLQVVDIWVPPLRERRDEILPLAHWFLKKHRRCDIAVPPLPPELEESLLRYCWPGNVRELENTMRKYLVFANAADLVNDLRRKSAQQAPVPSGASVPKTTDHRQPEPLVLPQAADIASKPVGSESDSSQLSSLLLALSACGRGASPDPSLASNSSWRKPEHFWEPAQSTVSSRFVSTAPAEAAWHREEHDGFAHAAPIAAIASPEPSLGMISNGSEENKDATAPWPGPSGAAARQFPEHAIRHGSLDARDLRHSDGVIGAPQTQRAPDPANPPSRDLRPGPLMTLLEIDEERNRAEREIIVAALRQSGWNRKRAAKLLQADYKAFLYRMKKLNIDERSAG
jgi:transcriptional regulator with GAF, ATPase, and Fis domain